MISYPSNLLFFFLSVQMIVGNTTVSTAVNAESSLGTIYLRPDDMDLVLVVLRLSNITVVRGHTSLDRRLEWSLT